MDNRRRRTRTGCLTCRARRVKCDERNPTCERCEAANIQCAGYERQRRVELPRRKRTRSVSDGSLTEQETNAPSPTLRADGLPLVCLPNSPDLTQRPHERARDILAYHQFLFRTVDTLFSPGDLYFWRDRLCGETWETEYIYDAIISLGNMHRAVVMLSQHNEIDQSRGMDTKVIAVRNYTRALEGLSENLEQAKTSVSLLVGVLVLLAYFEVRPQL
ncbi:Zn(II)2Cys6 transcription factor domain-containing protein [Aspergillus stella-maris]|uniref:Zn(II)2Cys6 transcription factor domain-containing protein n=1 Tax=Aspergillus stella-maris TaxID=1810926 RepID=UPI003CCE1D3D